MRKTLSLLLVVLILAALMQPVFAFEFYQDGIPNLNFTKGPYRGFDSVNRYLEQGGTITLQEDLVLYYSFGFSEDTVLDLNGHTITSYVSDYHYSETNVYHRSEWMGVVSGANVTIKNGTIKDMQIYIQPNANVTLENVTLTCEEGKDPRIENYGTIESINNCTISSGVLSEMVVNGGTIHSITNTTFTIPVGSHISNVGKIGTISGCTFVSEHSDASIFNGNGSRIETMNGNMMHNETGHFIMVNRGSIGSITNTYFHAARSAGYNTKGRVTKDKLSVLEDPFTDVPFSAYYAAPVYWARDNGVTTGTSETTFSPQESCTRGQVATFLWRAMGEPEPKNQENPFTDVTEEDYYYKAILWAVEEGITNGTSATTFAPNETCSNAHILTFLWRAMGQPDKTEAELWYADAEAWAKTQGLLVKTSAATNIAANCPRGDVVTFLFRVLGK